MAPRDPCPMCGGSGNERVVSNPDWPNGTKPYYESTGEDCPTCGGSGERRGQDEQTTFTIYVCSVCGKHQPGANPGDFNGCHTGRVRSLQVASVRQNDDVRPEQVCDSEEHR